MKTINLTYWKKATEPIPFKDIKKYIVEARENIPGKLDVYSMHQFHSLSYRIFTIDKPNDLDEDDFLEYARNNIPEYITSINITI